MDKNIVIIGSNGAIGKAFVEYYLKDTSVSNIFAFSRSNTNSTNDKLTNLHIDIESEESVANAAKRIDGHKIDVLITSTGILHSDRIKPEKSIKDINHESFMKILSINAVGPALIGRYFIPLLKKDTKSVIAFLSARVGSISDNKLGGWYSYRASKTALNQIVKNFSIELKRTNPNAIVLALQPGTVDSNLSEPFKRNVAKEKLFTPEQSREFLSDVIENATTNDSGNLLAYDGETISP
jgi:NAD(P)-dependent dehydrogenase (short-subunit alcohol dehydrogenase family)